MRRTRAVWLAAVMALVSVGCATETRVAADAARSVAAAADVAPHDGDGACSGGFVAHDLDHVTQGASSTTTMFDGTGSGAAIADLDRDGLLDVVLANLSGDTSVFWNRGEWAFERAPLAVGRFRAVATPDFDGDGNRDVVLTTGIGRPLWLRGTGDGFARVEIDEVDVFAYAIAFGDLGGDGDLDLVTGSYNAELTQQRDVAALLRVGAGVFVFERQGDEFDKTRLDKQAQALAVRIQDVDHDGRADVLVGNDLATPDGAWLAGEHGWQAVAPFPATTFSTMSLDGADIDNDGNLDIFATDMHPMSDDADTLEAWEPIFEDMEAQPVVEGSVQRMENVLLTAEGDEGYAVAEAPAYTGWSWSGVFGDLDNDGLVDLYVVNGMTADNLFPGLPGNELVEANQAFRNDESRLVPAPEWGLGDTAGGRGMAMGDLDGDGDLDIVVNNLGAPSRIFENQVCTGSALTVDLAWMGTANPDAIGATVRLDGAGSQVRLVDISRGYLSSSPARVHFGTGEAEMVDLEITWPDGAVSQVADLPTGSHVTITREGT